MQRLLDDVSVDTNGTPITHFGGGFTIEVRATSYGAGTVAIQGSTDETKWITLPIDPDNSTFATYTADTQIRGLLSPGYKLRAILTGSTGASGVTVTYSVG